MTAKNAFVIYYRIIHAFVNNSAACETNMYICGSNEARNRRSLKMTPRRKLEQGMSNS